MIVDTSALVAIVRAETGYRALVTALMTEGGFVPAPVVVEFYRVVKLSGNRFDPDAVRLIELAQASGVSVAPFDHEHATAATVANAAFGSGNMRGGKLNMLDLMVYGMARTLALPILCTGNDFAGTDALIHPASRIG